MIYIDGKQTAWTNTVESVISAAHEVVFGKKHDGRATIQSDYGAIEVSGGTAYTESKEIADAALEAGYWIQHDPLLGYEIFFDWSRDASKPPSKRAIHA